MPPIVPSTFTWFSFLSTTYHHLALHFIFILTISCQFLPPAVKLHGQRACPSYLSLNPHSLRQNLGHCKCSTDICWIIQCLTALPTRLYVSGEKHLGPSESHCVFQRWTFPILHVLFKTLSLPHLELGSTFTDWTFTTLQSNANRLFSLHPKVTHFLVRLSHYEKVQAILHRETIQEATCRVPADSPAKVPGCIHNWSCL